MEGPPTLILSMKRRQFIVSLAGTAAIGLTGWQLGRLVSSSKLVKVTRSGWALGTQTAVTVFSKDASQAEQAIDAAFRELNRVEDVMSLYRPDSEICRLNRDGFLNSPDPDLVEVLNLAKQLSKDTGGAFDVTIQPLWNVHFKHAEGGTIAPAEEIKEALAKVDWQRVSISPERIELDGEGTAITLNGVAQGFAADAVGRTLAGFGIQHALIDTGEIGAIGSHAEKDSWSIGIKHPRKENDFLGLAALNGRCLATSGDYETRFSDDYSQHHLLDTRTGLSPVELSSVSVVAKTALQADALSTAVFLFGVKNGKQLIEATPGADALFVTKDGTETRTAGFPMIS